MVSSSPRALFHSQLWLRPPSAWWPSVSFGGVSFRGRAPVGSLPRAGGLAVPKCGAVGESIAA
eukprot:15097438-Alexandrium_andersonii.AAC.1